MIKVLKERRACESSDHESYRKLTLRSQKKLCQKYHPQFRNIDF